MRTVGIILSLLCSLIIIVILWMGYITTFRDNQVIPPFGRLGLWHDVRAGASWVSVSLGSAGIPIYALARSKKPKSAHKITDWILFGISVYDLAFWSWVIVIRLHDWDLDWALTPLFILFAGCLYGLLIFWKRARYRMDEDTRPGLRQ